MAWGLDVRCYACDGPAHGLRGRDFAPDGTPGRVAPACERHAETGRVRFAARVTMMAGMLDIPAGWRLALEHEDRIPGVLVERVVVIATCDPWAAAPEGWAAVTVTKGTPLVPMVRS